MSSGARAGTSDTATPAHPSGPTVLPPSQRREAPDLRGSTLDGVSFALSSLRGHVVVLNVWASWCEPCRTESPALVAVAASVDAAGIRFVGLDERDSAVKARAFVQSVHSTYPHLVDQGALLAQLSEWLPQAVPSTLILDPQGRVAARVVGKVTEERLRTLLTQLTGTSATSTSATGAPDLKSATLGGAPAKVPCSDP
jgi:thiol-disulfide isomerase/thioredoxin